MADEGSDIWKTTLIALGIFGVSSVATQYFMDRDCSIHYGDSSSSLQVHGNRAGRNTGLLVAIASGSLALGGLLTRETKDMHEEVQQGKKKKKKLPRCPKNNKVHQKESKKPQKVLLA